MTSFPILRSATCIAAVLSASTAMADVTAAQVWADWQQNLSIYGEDGLTIGSEVMTGDTLIVSDIVLTFSDSTSNVTATMGDIAFSENADGTVSVAMAPSYDMVIAGNAGDTVNMQITQSGLDMVVSGTPAQMTYRISADQYGVIIDQITDTDGQIIDAEIRMIANDMTGSYTAQTDDMRNVDFDISAATIDILADVKPPETPGDYVTFSGQMSGLTTKGNLTMPTDPTTVDPAEIFSNGTQMTGSYGYDSAQYLFDARIEGETASGTATTGAGSVNAAFSQTGISYGANVQSLDVAVQGAGVPFPIEVSMAEYGFGITLPVTKSDTPADFGLNINLTDLNVNDVIWMMADPTGALPHDPVTMLLDISGKAKLFHDLSDPAFENADVPGELNALTLNDLTLKLGGAELTGLGDFTFDNSDLETFNGVPRPAGDLSLTLKGGNALIDGLVQMGVVPQDQAMMGRMMMGMFATVTGEDELTSKVEINDQGHVIANGQRIQ